MVLFLKSIKISSYNSYRIFINSHFYFVLKTSISILRHKNILKGHSWNTELKEMKCIVIHWWSIDDCCLKEFPCWTIQMNMFKKNKIGSQVGTWDQHVLRG